MGGRRLQIQAHLEVAGPSNVVSCGCIGSFASTMEPNKEIYWKVQLRTVLGRKEWFQQPEQELFEVSLGVLLRVHCILLPQDMSSGQNSLPKA